MAPEYLTLLDWAQAKYGTCAPHIVTLRRWVREGRIFPQPKKVGKTWFVKPGADYHGG